jgi:hypothetical protein
MIQKIKLMREEVVRLAKENAQSVSTVIPIHCFDTCVFKCEEQVT